MSNNNGQNNGLAMIFAFFTGFMAGAVISLLYAPSSGKETRKKIRDTSVEAKNRTIEFAKSSLRQRAARRTEHSWNRAKRSVHGIVDSGKEHLQQAGEQVKSAVETGRKVSADVRHQNRWVNPWCWWRAKLTKKLLRKPKCFFVACGPK